MSDVTRRMAKRPQVSETQEATPFQIANTVGRLEGFACSHWTGYGIESEVCQNYLHALSVLKAIMRDLPVNRDWLDPNIEKHAKYVISKAEEK